jgi:hypothetical protein
MINLKKKLMELSPEGLPEALATFLNNFNDSAYIIKLPPASDDAQTITTSSSSSSSIENDLINDVNQMLDEMYLNCVRITNFSDSEKKQIELFINKTRDILTKIINSLYQQVATLNANVTDLTKQINDLKKEQIETKRVNIVLEILGPLKKYIYNEIANINIPPSYYNVNVLKSLYWLHKDDTGATNFYINIHKMNHAFDDQLFNSLKHLMHLFSKNDNNGDH